MATFKQAAKNIRNVAKNVSENADIVVRKVALAIDQALVLSTPVDTGRARANWQVNVAAPATDVVTSFPAAAEGDVVGLPGVSGTFAMQAAIANTKGYSGGGIFIANNLPYIIPLNNGHSKQAEPGWVENAILNGIRAVRSVSFIEPPKAEDKE
jgi:hypothetical protein